MTEEAEFLTLAECAKLARVSESTIKREVRDGKLRPSRIRGRVRIARQVWERYCESCQLGNTEPAGKCEFNSPLDGLAALLRIGQTRSNTRNSSSAGSKIAVLAERRATASTKLSNDG